MNEKRTLILAIMMLISICLPYFFIDSGHDCRYDDCFRIYYNGKVGICVEKAINYLYNAIGVIWQFSIFGSLMVLDKQKNAISPFVILGLLLSLSVFGAFVDCSKWRFVLSLLPSLAIITIAVVIDSKEKKK